MSFHNALLNSGCFSKAIAMPLQASTPKVFPSRFKYWRLVHLLISSITGLAEILLILQNYMCNYNLTIFN
jgi:hypothetical protein